MLEAHGVQVGVIGIALPETPSMVNPTLISDLIFTDAAAEVANVLPEVEADGADLVVVLAHIGGYWPDFGELADFVCALDPDAIDLVVSGHTHSRIDDVICGIPVVQAYSSGTAFSRVDFLVDTATGEAVSYEMNYAPVSTYQTYYGDPASYQRWDTGEWVVVDPDPDVAAVVEFYAGQIEEIKNEVVGETLLPITRDYRHESAMGDWATDVMKAYDPSIDFAFTNSGGLRADIDAGEITFGEIFVAMPFDNTLVIVELTGDEVIAVLEEGITGDHGLIQVSGLQFTFDYDAPAGSRIIGDVIDLDTGLPLDPGTTYYVAVNDFMASGGDDYNTLAANPQTNTYAIVRDLLVDWVKVNSPFTPPDPGVEMRITALGTAPP
jgi:2',3'-cyclic-nucleotide 2'-phosphodiesterase (5'-nucleotidase family)